jgi:hypothetical protein
MPAAASSTHNESCNFAASSENASASRNKCKYSARNFCPSSRTFARKLCARAVKNSSKLFAKIARKRTRSSNGKSGRVACNKTRWLNVNQERSREICNPRGLGNRFCFDDSGFNLHTCILTGEPEKPCQMKTGFQSCHWRALSPARASRPEPPLSMRGVDCAIAQSGESWNTLLHCTDVMNPLSF